MKISLATNYTDELIDRLEGYPIYEIYGKMKHDILGGGRADNSLVDVSRKEFEAHVKKVREAGFNFNYLLNGSCLSNLEQSPEWQAKFIEELKYLQSIGVNALTITNPFVLKLVKKNFDCFITRISTFACIDSFAKAKFWEDIGADILCVDFTKVNRNFELLEYMCKNLKHAKVELLCTNSCLKDCPLIGTHTTALSHASNQFENGQKYQDWCLFECQEKELNHPEEYIKSPWIRPEDVEKYERIGVEHFKLTERDFPTDELMRRVDAYTFRKYEGNLLDLVQGHGWSKRKEFDATEKTNLETTDEIYKEIKRVRGLGQEREFDRHIYIDNNKLDGFIDFFVEGHCKGICEKCGYCKKYAEEVITENKEVSNYLKRLYKKFDDKKLI